MSWLRFGMSNFAAMSGSDLGSVSVLEKSTSEIIDAKSNDKYVFWEVDVGIRIQYPLKILELASGVQVAGCAEIEVYGTPYHLFRMR